MHTDHIEKLANLIHLCIENEYRSSDTPLGHELLATYALEMELNRRRIKLEEMQNEMGEDLPQSTSNES